MFIGKRRKKMYQLNHNNNPDAVIRVKTITYLREALRDFWDSAFTIVPDNSPELEDDFLFRSKSQYDSIENMEFEQIKEEIAKFDWSLWKLDLTVEELTLIQAIRKSGLTIQKLTNEINNVYRETPHQEAFREAMRELAK
jgi:hypothetical protein